MSKIIELKIKNFRGIKELSLKFPQEQNLICFIGRGDSCKTTILEAISYVLSPSWNLTFYDSDFHSCNYDEQIEIEASLIDFPQELLSENKFGLNIRCLAENNEIKDDVCIDDIKIPVLTIKLTVDKSLEPKWFIANTREQEDKNINGTDRAKLNCYLISDYIDRHFSWNKGNPLYALQRSSDEEVKTDGNDIAIEAIRNAKSKFDGNTFESLKTITDKIQELASQIGLNISEIRSTLDFKEISIKEGRISLHDNEIPFRLKGKGSKRLASIAIQSLLVKNGGIVLIDEIEQGLEPDRAKHLVRYLKEANSGQIFITTHSRDVITELGAEPLYFFIRDEKNAEIKFRRFNDTNSDNFQKTIRACPEAFFAKKIILCEGATEVGICRALDNWRKTKDSKQMSFKDCAYVDGTGSELLSRIKCISECMKVAIFCDSDDAKVNSEKTTLNAKIFDCEDNLCIEQQIFKDLPWDGIKELILYHLKSENKEIKSLEDSLKSKLNGNILPSDWLDKDDKTIRNIFGEISKKDGWFKGIHHGEFLGKTIFNYFDNIDDNAKLKQTLRGLSDWIDNESGK